MTHKPFSLWFKGRLGWFLVGVYDRRETALETVQSWQRYAGVEHKIVDHVRIKSTVSHRNKR